MNNIEEWDIQSCNNIQLREYRNMLRNNHLSNTLQNKAKK